MKTRFLPLVLALVLCTTLTALAAPAAANPYEDQVRGQLLAAAVVLFAHDVAPTHEPILAATGNGQVGRHQAWLDAGTTYALVGVCDVDCSDLDLFVYDAGGRLLGSDTQTDDRPVVEVRVPYRQRVEIRARMYSCRDQPCYYGLAFFAER